MKNTDTYHLLAGAQYEASNTLIAAIDYETLHFLSDTPLLFWGPYFSKVIHNLKLAGALCIVFDIHFAITPNQWLSTLNIQPESLIDYDQNFDIQISESNTILAATVIRKNNVIAVLMPPLEYLSFLKNGIQDVGLTILTPDKDYVVRNFIQSYQGNSLNEQTIETHWLSLSALAVKKVRGESTIDYYDSNHNNSPITISYCGPPNTIPRISLGMLFQDHGLTQEEKSLIKNRIVFIGSGDAIFGDHQPTPYSSKFLLFKNYPLMDSVEIHANIAETLLNPGRTTILPLWTSALIWLPLLIVSLSLHLKFKKIWSASLINIMLLIVVWFIGMLFFINGYLFQQAGFFTALSIIFFIISNISLLDNPTIIRHIKKRKILNQLYKKIFIIGS